MANIRSCYNTAQILMLQCRILDTTTKPIITKQKLFTLHFSPFTRLCFCCLSEVHTCIFSFKKDEQVQFFVLMMVVGIASPPPSFLYLNLSHPPHLSQWWGPRWGKALSKTLHFHWNRNLFSKSGKQAQCKLFGNIPVEAYEKFDGSGEQR